MEVLLRIEFKHMPVHFELQLASNYQTRKNVPKISKIKRFVWTKQLEPEYVAEFSSEHVQLLLNCALHLIKIDINLALEKFNEALYKAGNCMQKEITIGKNYKKPWFDSDCWRKRQEARLALRQFKRCKIVETKNDLRVRYCDLLRQYKHLLNEKQRDYKKHLIRTINDSKNDPKMFWKTIKSVSKVAQTTNDITNDQWFQHFKTVFNPDGLQCSDDLVDNNDSTYVNGSNYDISDLEKEISESEVKDAIKALKNDKAAGPDRLCSEFYKCADTYVIHFLTSYFNELFNFGKFPSEWSEAIIQPIHKKGDVNLPNNYRGISLLNISSKMYSYILNKRLTLWVENNNLISEMQAGFRKKYSTIDHIFTLFALIKKQLSNNQKLYVAFIDFQKAFDLVDRNLLWSILKKHGIQGKCTRH